MLDGVATLQISNPSPVEKRYTSYARVAAARSGWRDLVGETTKVEAEVTATNGHVVVFDPAPTYWTTV